LKAKNINHLVKKALREILRAFCQDIFTFGEGMEDITSEQAEMVGNIQ